jgi:hypothetical protein
MDSEEKLQSIVKDKCTPCYKKGWCMLLASQRSECLGPFKHEKDNLLKFRKFAEAELKKPERTINKALYEAMKDIRKRMRREFYGWEDDRKSDNE